MHFRSRLAIAAIIGIYGLAVMLAISLLALKFDPEAFGSFFAMSLYSFIAAALAGYIAAPLFGHHSIGGIVISLFGATVTTCIAVSIAVIIITGPGLAYGAFMSGAFLAALKAILVGAVLSVMAVVEGIYVNLSVLIIWLAGMFVTHVAARIIRRKTDLRPFNP